MESYTLPTLVSARQIQRGYLKVFNQVKKSNRPALVVSNNIPQAAIISIKMLEEFLDIQAEKNAWAEIDRVRQLNKNIDTDRAYQEITKIIDDVRVENYDRTAKNLSR